MEKDFTELEAAERRLLERRLDILEHNWRLVDEEQKQYYPEIEFALREVRDIDAVMSTLADVKRVYGRR
jgi:hypothetical protein